MFHPLLICAVIVVGGIVILIFAGILLSIHFACVVARAEALREQTGCTEEDAMFQVLQEVSVESSVIFNPNGLLG